jgi:hypothetical protein
MACFADRAPTPATHPVQPISMRIGDLERAAATDRLAAHAAAGRLSTDELEDRVGALHDARTAGDLLDVERDLPRPLPRRRRQARVRAAAGRPALVAAIAVLVAIGLSTAWTGHSVPPPLVFALVVFIVVRRGHRGPRRASGTVPGRRRNPRRGANDDPGHSLRRAGVPGGAGRS